MENADPIVPSVPASHDEPGPYDPARVLIVDDCEDAADTLAATLELDGYAVQTAYDGEQALAVIESFRPHCVVLDVDMPKISGDELSGKVKARYGDDVVLIAVTGFPPSDARVLLAFERVDHYLQKPNFIDALRKVLKPLKG